MRVSRACCGVKGLSHWHLGIINCATVASSRCRTFETLVLKIVKSKQKHLNLTQDKIYLFVFLFLTVLEL